jgi:alkanesulfonate monooxygenase SsuD/methylene tetrahydromethanopterin reductase-like flavin-dependent oxidoreductase (luciferase family)
MEAFKDDVQWRFCARVATYLRSHLPEPTQSLSATDLETRIAHWQERAAAHGIRSERGIAKWCYLSVVLGETFDELPAIHDYLKQLTPPPDQKVDNLIRTLELRMKMMESQRG